MPFVEALESRRLLATTYYVSATGNDNASGTSTATAWKSIARVDKTDLNPGDKVLFQGGKTFSVSGSAGANLLTNTGFESGIGSWTDTQGTPAANGSVTTNEHHSGTHALKLSGSGLAARAENITGKVHPGQTYEMTFWSLTTNNGGGSHEVGVVFYQGSVEVARYYSGSKTDYWSQTQFSFVAPPVFDKVEVFASRTRDNATYYVDDVTLQSIPNGLIFDSSDSGTPSAPITIGSYGTGRATINAVNSIGLFGTNLSNLIVDNINFTGSWNSTTGSGANVGVGIELAATRAGSSKLPSINIADVDVKGFRWGGIVIGGWQDKSGYNGVTITDSALHDNGDVGVQIRGEFDPTSTLYSNENVTITNVSAYNNSGIANKGNNSGNGIEIDDTLGATIQRCVAYNNGKFNNNTDGGPVGIWAFDASKIVIQYNESYDNHSASKYDGAGFDLDGGVTDSILQYNYSHDNDGAGFLLCQFTGARAWGDNICRYNISQNDARKNDYGAITLTGGPGPKNLIVENNAVYISASPSGGTAAGLRVKYAQTGVYLRNNIIYASGGAPVIDVESAGAGANFNGNDYFSASGGLKFKWKGTTYTSLSSWRSASTRELNGSAATGYSVDPKLASPGKAPTLGDANKLSTLTQYKLLSGSPMIDKAVALASPFSGYTSAKTDFFGRALPSTKRDIGASEGT